MTIYTSVRCRCIKDVIGVSPNLRVLGLTTEIFLPPAMVYRARPPTRFHVTGSNGQGREREETGIRAKDHRSGARVLYPTAPLCYRWHGPSRNHHLQESGIPPGRKEGEALLQDLGMAVMQAELLADSFSDPMCSRCAFRQAPTKQANNGI